jgi:hypothetical protein
MPLRAPIPSPPGHRSPAESLAPIGFVSPNKKSRDRAHRSLVPSPQSPVPTPATDPRSLNPDPRLYGPPAPGS